MEIEDDPETDIFQIDHDCVDGDDHQCDDHPDCIRSGAAELGQLWHALTTFQGRELKAVVAAYPEVVFNPERKALQILWCQGVIAHLPLNDSQMRALAE